MPTPASRSPMVPIPSFLTAIVPLSYLKNDSIRTYATTEARNFRLERIWQMGSTTKTPSKLCQSRQTREGYFRAPTQCQLNRSWKPYQSRTCCRNLSRVRRTPGLRHRRPRPYTDRRMNNGADRATGVNSAFSRTDQKDATAPVVGAGFEPTTFGLSPTS